jgi:hypothetical protein
MKCYRIANWGREFEVTNKGQPPAGYLEMAQRRKGPLKYIRWPVMGLASSAELDALIKRSWRPGQLYHWAVLGIYIKLLDIAANLEREKRGWLVDKNNNPIGPGYFAERFNEPDPQAIIDAFDILEDLGWLEKRDVPDFIVAGDSGDSGKPGKAAKARTHKRPQQVQQQLDKLYEAEKQRQNETAAKGQDQKEPGRSNNPAESKPAEHRAVPAADC